MKRFIIAGALLLAISTFAFAQKRTDIFENFDLDSTTELFCDTATFTTSPPFPKGMTQCNTGSAAEDGWIDARTEDFKGVAIHIDAMALSSGTIDIAIYGRVKSGATPIQLGLTIDFAAAATRYVVVPEALREIRIGLVINGTDDGDGADEDISIYYFGSRRLN